MYGITSAPAYATEFNQELPARSLSNGHAQPQTDEPPYDFNTFMKEGEQFDDDRHISGRHLDSLLNLEVQDAQIASSYDDYIRNHLQHNYYFPIDHDYIGSENDLIVHHDNSQEGPSSTTQNHFVSIQTPMVQGKVLNENMNSGKQKWHSYQEKINEEPSRYNPYQRRTPKEEESLVTFNQCSSSALNISDVHNSDANISYPASPTINHPRQVLSQQEIDDILNADIGEGVSLNTKEVASAIYSELKEHSISQSKFAKRVLSVSQGTLSELLRNPKPWENLKCGRQTWCRMYNWFQQPLETKLAILEMSQAEMKDAPGIPPANKKRRSEEEGPVVKKARLVFTDIQKKTLMAVFKETQRPDRQMQENIAEHLHLELSTVSNFFLNARRRNRTEVNAEEDNQ